VPREPAPDPEVADLSATFEHAIGQGIRRDERIYLTIGLTIAWLALALMAEVIYRVLQNRRSNVD